MEFQKICKELDELAVRYFQILDELSERKRKVELLLKEGFLNLSKARYSMGNRAVGKLQYDSNVMKALVDVQVSEEDETNTFQLIRNKPKPRNTNQSGTKSENQKEQISSEKGSQVRRRKGKSETTQEASEQSKEEIELEERGNKNEDPEAEASLVDPLHWFGILVPSALRQGQSDFVQAIDHSVRIASLQNQLMSLQEQYKAMYKTKKQLRRKLETEEQVEELSSNGICGNDD